MKKVSTWFRVGLFLVIAAAAVVIFILPALGDTAPGGPKLSFGGSGTCQLGGALEDFNAAGFYMSRDVQEHTYTGLSTQDSLSVYLSADRVQSCGKGQLVNKGDQWLKGTECMVFSFRLNYADGGYMTCNGTETLGNTQEAIRAGLGAPAKQLSTYDEYTYKKRGRTYTFQFSYDESGICSSVSAYQEDPNLSFYSI